MVYVPPWHGVQVQASYYLSDRTPSSIKASNSFFILINLLKRHFPSYMWQLSVSLVHVLSYILPSAEGTQSFQFSMLHNPY